MAPGSERRPISIYVIGISGDTLLERLYELMPTLTISSNIPTIASVKPYTPLGIAGTATYTSEKDASTVIRKQYGHFAPKLRRYGEYSKAGEFVYDHPFLWGSKRTGPDLAREGGKYGDSWHYNHLMDPRLMSPGSIMPEYDWLLTQKLDTTTTVAKISVMRKLGVPYAPGFENIANQDLDRQAQGYCR